jgi:hypothetical protein
MVRRRALSVFMRNLSAVGHVSSVRHGKSGRPLGAGRARGRILARRDPHT